MIRPALCAQLERCLKEAADARRRMIATDGAAHTEEHLDRAVVTFTRVGRELGVFGV